MTESESDEFEQIIVVKKTSQRHQRPIHRSETPSFTDGIIIPHRNIIEERDDSTPNFQEFIPTPKEPLIPNTKSDQRSGWWKHSLFIFNLILGLFVFVSVVLNVLFIRIPILKKGSIYWLKPELWVSIFITPPIGIYFILRRRGSFPTLRRLMKQPFALFPELQGRINNITKSKLFEYIIYIAELSILVRFFLISFAASNITYYPIISLIFLILHTVITVILYIYVTIVSLTSNVEPTNVTKHEIVVISFSAFFSFVDFAWGIVNLVLKGTPDPIISGIISFLLGTSYCVVFYLEAYDLYTTYKTLKMKQYVTKLTTLFSLHVAIYLIFLVKLYELFP